MSRMGAPPESRGRDRGSATVLALGLVAAELVVGTAMFSVTAATAQRHRAASAADAAALAADAVVLGDLAGDACDLGAEVAVANGAALDACDVAGVEVRVTASVTGPWGAARVAARAGPGDLDTPRRQDQAD